MNKIIAYLNDDNKVGWLVPMSEWPGTLEELIQKDLGDKSYVIYNREDFPSDFTFYDAWGLSDTEITTDINAAKEIWKNKWREARKPKLEALDLAYMRATETQNASEIARIISEKQELRDVTNTPIPGTTPEEIKAVWPEILN